MTHYDRTNSDPQVKQLLNVLAEYERAHLVGTRKRLGVKRLQVVNAWGFF